MAQLNLSKGEKIDLVKTDGSSFTEVFMGLGWDPVKSGGLFGFGGSSGSIDLDASCAMLSDTNQLMDTVSFRKLQSSDRSVKHSGDNLTGDGDGDDEVIGVKLDQVPANVTKLVFVINSFQGQTFDQVQNCFARLVDYRTKQEIFRYTLSEKGNHTGKVMCMLYRRNGQWKAQAIGRPCNGRTINDIMPEILAAV